MTKRQIEKKAKEMANKYAALVLNFFYKKKRTMKIGLIDVDGHNFPNFALMRLASFHRAKGDEVEWVFPFARYDRIYRSKVFTFTPDDLTTYQCDDIRDGGTGYDIKSRLTEEVERHTGLAYDLYPQYPFSVQFFSRGCVRHCPFCLVRDKEGDIHPVTPADLNPRGQWIEVLDNNFFANPAWREAVKTLQKTKIPVNLHGVDVRIIDEEQAAALNSLKLKKNIHIAWDLPQIDLTDKLTMMVKLIPAYKITCYVLVGFNSTMEQDLHRLRTLKRLGILPFVQPYRDFTTNRQPTAYERDLARWANRAWLFKSMDFADFRPRKNFCCKDYLF